MVTAKQVPPLRHAVLCISGPVQGSLCERGGELVVTTGVLTVLTAPLGTTGMTGAAVTGFLGGTGRAGVLLQQSET